VNNSDKIRFKNLLSEADHAAHYGDKDRASTLLLEAMMLLTNKKAPVVAGA